ncbi:class I SAM-dependent methyltransferase [Nocardia sp. NPDC060256]|uniref:class I SAM-dependent methyltransferase n=1 Tax=unclassified Nocardia TaxID=2637762 RepID=UPI003669061A
MAELTLTDERRDQLAALLADEHLLKAKYPKVADYLDTAPMLPGTGDDQADAAFDLRFVHYMTGGEAESRNPYWDIVGPSISVRDGHRLIDGGRSQGSARLGYAQTILQAVYAYAVPAPETIAWMRSFCDGRAVVELGAGRGYWAAQLKKAGVHVDAYDVEPPDQADNVSFPGAAGQRDVWHPVEGLAGTAARLRGAADDVLFLCWPPGWGNTMASETLEEYERAGGERIVFVGEPQGGKTADDAFFSSLASNWHLAAEDPDYVSWWNLADVAQGWTRR